MRKRIEGLIAAPFTAMKQDGSIDLDAIGGLAEFLHRNGVKGAFVNGTSGESLSLTTRERLMITERWVEAAPPGFKILVHIGHNSIEDCKTMAEHAQKVGAFSIGLMPPCFFKPRNAGELADFCARVAERAPDLPFYYYHIPSLTGVFLNMVDFLETAGPMIPNLAGIKFTFEDLMQYRLCGTLEGGRYDMLFGRDEILLCGLTLGTRGAIGSTYNYAAPLYTEMIAAFNSGNLEKARELQDKSMKMIRLIDSGFGLDFISVSKQVMKIIGMDIGSARPPKTNPTPAEAARIKAGLDSIGFFDYCCR